MPLGSSNCAFYEWIIGNHLRKLMNMEHICKFTEKRPEARKPNQFPISNRNLLIICFCIN